MIQVLLVHTKFKWLEPKTWLSYLIRMFTSSKWSHAAIRINDRIIESTSEGVHIESYDEWYSKLDRIVKVLIPKEEVQLHLEEVLWTEGIDYGFLELIQTARRIKAERWDGKEIELKDVNGLLCSDIVCILLGLPKKYTPADIDNLRLFHNLLDEGYEYITVKA